LESTSLHVVVNGLVLRAKAVFYGHAFDLSDVEACAPTEATQTPFAFPLAPNQEKQK
jgi:hypothetical protein